MKRPASDVQNLFQSEGLKRKQSVSSASSSSGRLVACCLRSSKLCLGRLLLQGSSGVGHGIQKATSLCCRCMVAEFDPRFRRPSHRARGFFVQCSTPPKNLAKAGKFDWMPTAGWSLGFRTPTKEPPVLLHMWLWTTRFKGCNSIETLDFRTCRDINPFNVYVIRKCMPDCI